MENRACVGECAHGCISHFSITTVTLPLYGHHDCTNGCCFHSCLCGCLITEISDFVHIHLKETISVFFSCLLHLDRNDAEFYCDEGKSLQQKNYVKI